MSTIPERMRKEIGVALVLAALWGFHAAAYSYPGRAYFRLLGLNDISKPVSFPVLLLPAFVFTLPLVVFRWRSRRDAPRGNKCGLSVALGCWLVGATISTLINAQVDQVVLTYCSVFLAGAAVYAALAGIRPTPRELEIGVLGLAVGSTFPLVGGLYAFAQEWGVPDAPTALSAYQDLFRMQAYQLATFGNRGNTAGFIVIVTPLFLWIALDANRTRWIRIICTAVLTAIVLNMLILQVRAAFVTTLFALTAVWGFRFGIRRYPLFGVGLVLASILLVRYSPDIVMMMSDRLRPALTFDTEDDTSVLARGEAIKEGIVLADRNWQFGIGPGGALSRHSQTSAHQFQVQQFMEVGALGLVGSTLFAATVLLLLLRTVIRGRDGGINDVRFALIVGPASYVVYGLLANVTFNVGYVNTWTVLIASMVAMTPPLDLPGVKGRSMFAI